MDNVEWKEASENEDGIETIAFIELDAVTNVGRIVGYNGILKGDKVLYQDKEYTVVMVSRLGHIGLSETGELPYTETAYPREIKKIKDKCVMCEKKINTSNTKEFEYGDEGEPWCIPCFDRESDTGDVN